MFCGMHSTDAPYATRDISVVVSGNVRAWTHATSPSLQARCSGVFPLRSRCSSSAPIATSLRTTSACFVITARCKGACPKVFWMLRKLESGHKSIIFAATSGISWMIAMCSFLKWTWRENFVHNDNKLNWSTGFWLMEIFSSVSFIHNKEWSELLWIINESMTK